MTAGRVSYWPQSLSPQTNKNEIASLPLHFNNSISGKAFLWC
jgi:hypothetical protein